MPSLALVATCIVGVAHEVRAESPGRCAPDERTSAAGTATGRCGFGAAPGRRQSIAAVAGARPDGRSRAREDAEERPADTTLVSRPRWEFGVGAGYFEAPDYPGSGNTNRAALALPFFIYRSPVWRLDDGGLQAVALENPRLKIDFSIAGSLSANSDDDGLRNGMPDLDYLVELGPELTLLLTAPDATRRDPWRVALDLRLRAVLSTDFRGFDRQGTVLESALTVRRRALAGQPLDAFVSLSSLVATETLHDYFYEVDPVFARPDRPAYDADGGYLGTQLGFGLSYRPRSDLRLVVAIARDFHHGSANTDSPLFEDETTGSAGVGLVWTIRQSESRVRVLDTD